MLLRDLMATLRRRWTLLVVAILVTAGAVYATVAQVPPTYELQSSVVLIPPPSTDDPNANRYLSLGSLGQATSVLIRALNSDAIHSKVKAAEPDGDYVVEPDWTTSAPILVVTAKGPDREACLRTATELQNQIPLALADLQDRLGIKNASQIVSLPLTQDELPTTVNKTRVRIAVAMTLALFGILVMAIAAFDSLLMRRKPKAKTVGPSTDTPESTRGDVGSPRPVAHVSVPAVDPPHRPPPAPTDPRKTAVSMAAPARRTSADSPTDVANTDVEDGAIDSEAVVAPTNGAQRSGVPNHGVKRNRKQQQPGATRKPTRPKPR